MEPARGAPVGSVGPLAPTDVPSPPAGSMAPPDAPRVRGPKPHPSADIPLVEANRRVVDLPPEQQPRRPRPHRRSRSGRPIPLSNLPVPEHPSPKTTTSSAGAISSLVMPCRRGSRPSGSAARGSGN